MNLFPLTSRLVAAAFVALVASQAQAQVAGVFDERALREDPRRAKAAIAPNLEGIGTHHHPVTTQSEAAQRFFDQGIKLTFAFNHQEALRAFKEAARLDPDCAMAYWGWALVLGPNINLPMQKDVMAQAYEAMQLAVARKDKAPAAERGYIEALAKRYAANPEADRVALDRAYADAMRAMHEQYPDDNDAATLYAASLMELSPWNYWTRDGLPLENTLEIQSVLEGVLESDPEHEGALHYYIHAVEAAEPARGEKAADALLRLAPGAGHMVHMPSHIYIQLGRYADAYDCNALAAKADEGYISQCRAQGIYPLNYYPHNVHFQGWAAMLQGRSQQAFADARKVAGGVPEDMVGNIWGLYETFLSMPYFVMVRFGMWDEVLNEPMPPETRRYSTGVWRYARGVALAQRGKLGEARAELAALTKLADDPKTAAVAIGFSNAAQLLGIARLVLLGEIATREHDFDAAVAHLDRAVRLQDGLLYTEPPDWYYPVRHTLGAVLLEAGRAKEAEVVYTQDLKKNRNNGFALFGVWKSLEAQGRAADATAAEKRFRAVWSVADVQLASSRF